MGDPPPRPPLQDSATSDTAADASAQALLASVQRLTGIGVWTHAVDADETWLSDRATDIYEFDPAADPAFTELADRCDDGTDLLASFETAIETGEFFALDVGLTGEGTTQRTIRVTGEPQTAADDVVALHGTVQDITDEKRREQRIEVLRETSQQLRGANSRQEVATILANAAKNILGLVNTTVRLVDQNDTILETLEATEECVQRAGDRPDYRVDEETPAARTYRTGEPELHADHDETDDDHNRGELRSGLYVPIGNHGVLSAGDVVIDAFETHDLEAASLLGQLGAEAITRIGWVRRSRAV